MENSSKIRFYYDTASQLNFNCSLELGRWDYFVVSIIPEETKYSFDLYKNGVFIQNTESNKMTGNYYNTAFKIGTRTDTSANSNTNFFRGLIDDVRVYNATLSYSQIKQNYVAGLNSLLSNSLISKEEYNERIIALSI